MPFAKYCRVAKLRNWKITLWEIRIAYKILVVKHGENKPAEIPGFRLNINIKLGIKMYKGPEVVEWLLLTPNRGQA